MTRRRREDGPGLFGPDDDAPAVGAYGPNASRRRVATDRRETCEKCGVEMLAARELLVCPYCGWEVRVRIPAPPADDAPNYARPLDQVEPLQARVDRLERAIREALPWLTELGGRTAMPLTALNILESALEASSGAGEAA